MKITEKQLKQLIKEEIQNLLKEDPVVPLSGMTITAQAPRQSARRRGQQARPGPVVPSNSSDQFERGMERGYTINQSHIPDSPDRQASFTSSVGAAERDPVFPAQVDNDAKQVYDRQVQGSLINQIRRLGTLLNRNLDPQALQLATWMRQSIGAKQRNISNIYRTVSDRTTGAFTYPQYRTRLMQWVGQARSIVSQLSSLLPSDLTSIPAGSPGRQQIVQSLYSFAARLNRLGESWFGIKTDYVDAYRRAPRRRTTGSHSAYNQARITAPGGTTQVVWTDSSSVPSPLVNYSQPE